MKPKRVEPLSRSKRIGALTRYALSLLSRGNIDMKKLFQKSSILLLALSSLGLVACGEPAPTPTPSESESLVSESSSEEKVEVVSIEAARKAEKDTKLSVTGTVLAISYANGKVPNGVIIADDTSSIYVYGNDLAGSSPKAIRSRSPRRKPTSSWRRNPKPPKRSATKARPNSPTPRSSAKKPAALGTKRKSQR